MDDIKTDLKWDGVMNWIGLGRRWAVVNAAVNVKFAEEKRAISVTAEDLLTS